jgi:hypothetical protein
MTTKKNQPKFDTPTVRIQLNAPEGNTFVILGRVRQAMKEAGATKEEMDQFHLEATAGDYKQLLKVCGQWVNFKVF